MRLKIDIEKKKASAAVHGEPPSFKCTVSAARGLLRPRYCQPIKNQSVEVQNNQTVRSDCPLNNAPAQEIYILEVDTIYDGQLWEARVEVDADGRSEHVVLLNKHHDFYQRSTNPLQRILFRNRFTYLVHGKR